MRVEYFAFLSPCQAFSYFVRLQGAMNKVGLPAVALQMGRIAFAEGICCNPTSGDCQRPEANMFREKVRRLRWVWMVPLAIAIPVLGQAPTKPAGQAPATSGGAKKPGVPQAAPAPAAPQSKHFPILLIASG